MGAVGGIREEGGFTLVELLVVVIIGVIVVGASLVFLVSVIRSQSDVRDRSAAVQQARVMVEAVTRDLRDAYEVELAQPNTLTVLAYVNRSSCGGSPATSSIQCRISYNCAAGSCDRSEGPPGGGPGTPVEVVRGIAAEDVFSYSPDAADPTFAGVRVRMPVGDGSEDAITLEDGVALRNVVLAG